MRLSSFSKPLVLSLVFPVTWCFSEKTYQDFIHYGQYAKLSTCITRNKLSEGLLKDVCDLSICSENKKLSSVEVVKIRNAPIDENGTGFVAVDHKNQEVIVAFRGSTTTSDWISDFEIVLKDYVPISEYQEEIPKCQGCKVHKGFYKHLHSITDSILRPTERLFLKYPHYKLVVVGHSLGGALAILVGVEFRVKGFRPLVFSYGSPRIFNPIMQNWVNEIFESESLSRRIRSGKPIDWGVVRLIHEGDYVPSLPKNFKQAGVEFFIKKVDLPHLQLDVDFLGVNYIENTKSWQNILDLLHAYEHRTYFMTINKCDDSDYKWLIEDGNQLDNQLDNRQSTKYHSI